MSDEAFVVRTVLRDLIDPELGVNVVDLGLVTDVAVDPEADDAVRVTMTATTPSCPLAPYLRDEADRMLSTAFGDRPVDVRMSFDVPWEPSRMSERARAQLGWPA